VSAPPSSKPDLISVRSFASFIFSAIRPFRLLILAHAAVTVLWAADLSLRPLLLKMIIDRIPALAPQEAYIQLALPVGLYLGASVLMSVIYRLYDLIIIKFSAPLRRHVGLVLMERMMLHSAQFYNTNFAGSLGSRMRDVMTGVVALVRILIDHFFSQFMALGIAIVTLWSVNAHFALALCVWSAIYVLSSIRLARKARLYSENAAQAYSGVVGTIIDILSNMTAVRLFNGRRAEQKNIAASLDKYVTLEDQRGYYFLNMFIFQGALSLTYQAVSILWVVRGFGHGIVTAGDFVLIIMINKAIIERLGSLSRDIGYLAEHAGNISQGLSIVLEPYQIIDRKGAEPLVVKRGEIIFENISFSYKDSKVLFKGNSLCIKPGQRVGLVGYSGSGKSSLINIMLRLYGLSSGRILIDGQDISRVTQDSLHNAIGVIMQDTHLFHRSIMENIRYGKHDASDEEVIAAAKSARAHEFIMERPDGYHTQAGERGMRLSGGQRQRITIARAILKNAPILVLDEATSQLDSVTEAQIKESLSQLMKGKTTLVIAHRLSTLLHMDRILVFEQGRIVQDGSHKELLTTKGLYSTLWHTQSFGLLPEFCPNTLTKDPNETYIKLSSQ